MPDLSENVQVLDSIMSDGLRGRCLQLVRVANFRDVLHVLIQDDLSHWVEHAPRVLQDRFCLLWLLAILLPDVCLVHKLAGAIELYAFYSLRHPDRGFLYRNRQLFAHGCAVLCKELHLLIFRESSECRCLLLPNLRQHTLHPTLQRVAIGAAEPPAGASRRSPSGVALYTELGVFHLQGTASGCHAAQRGPHTMQCWSSQESLRLVRWRKKSVAHILCNNSSKHTRVTQTLMHYHGHGCCDHECFRRGT